VEHASLAGSIPFFSYSVYSVTVPDHHEIAGADLCRVSEGYFETLGALVRRGRLISDQDGAGSPPVAVINETMARRLWPGENPLGKCFQIGSDPCTTVVGVVQDMRRGLREPAGLPLQFYLSLAQDRQPVPNVALFVRVASGDPGAMENAVRREIATLAPDLPFIEVRPLNELVENQSRPWRMGATLFRLFGFLATAIALSGIYAATGHAVASRKREIGVRIALGARARHLFRLVLISGLAVVVVGLAIGVYLALASGRWLEPLLFNVRMDDPGVVLEAVLALFVTAAVASLVPAIGALRVPPAEVLRGE
jgi:hypothetical protein